MSDNSREMLIARMERLPLGSFHYRMLVINGCAWAFDAFDAFDVGLVTFVVTALTQAWNLTTTQVGAIFIKYWISRHVRWCFAFRAHC
ncbi:MAG TPA: hypothetical protein VM640_08570 [Desulfitobacterium sp.]|nr:hypothetical protein [Desulfitobacterium sp.]HVJ49167.1 hypothetical protein [Desulfitobacterium sp.]